MRKNKIQQMLVEHLLKNGQIELVLPDGVILEIGLTQEAPNGELKIKDDYCWIIATHGGRSTSLDPYNMGLRFSEDEHLLVLDDTFTDHKGEQVRRLDVV